MFPTELRITSDRSEDDINGIFNIGDYVVNIKNLTINKEGGIMLENEKTFKLEQLNALKGKYEDRLEEIKAQDITLLVDERLATIREGIENDVASEHEALIVKTEMKLEAINEMIAEVEAIEVEMPTNEEDSTVDNVEEVPAETVEVETAVDEFQPEMPVDERPMI